MVSPAGTAILVPWYSGPSAEDAVVPGVPAVRRSEYLPLQVESEAAGASAVGPEARILTDGSPPRLFEQPRRAPTRTGTVAH